MFRAGMAVLILIWSASAHAGEQLTASQFGIIATKGYVKYYLPDNCHILGMQTKPPISTIVCQLKNHADEGTPDSTNLAINLFHIDYEAGKKGVAQVGEQYGLERPRVRTIDGWTVFEQKALQRNTPYTILDAKKPVASPAQQCLRL